MDKINSLPDECLVSIISFLPTKVSVSTSVLSKRWECLWMWMLKLEYYDGKEYTQSEFDKLRCFLHKNLSLHKARVMEKLSLKFFSTHVKHEDVNLWVVVAASRCIRELEISYSSFPVILPSSLFNNKSLVILKLDGRILMKVVPHNVCLPSFKNLQLRNVKYVCEESLQSLLSICPVLEDPLVDFGRNNNNNMKKFTIIVPSLQRLTLIIPYAPDLNGFVINTPSLEYFKLEDRIPKRDYYVIEYMPMIVEAYVDVVFQAGVKSLIGSITSVKRLTLNINIIYPEVVYGDGVVFKHLDHLKLCVRPYYLPNLLIRLLKDSPNLRILDMEADCRYSPLCRWDEPTMVPGCLLSSLQIFNWSLYYGSSEEKNLAVYILKNARGLKSATLSSQELGVPKHEMLKELALSSRASTTCQLVFEYVCFVFMI